jgi:SOS-response transcriptional repressor LexA
MMLYSNVLSRLRKERGLTQSEVAEYVSKYSGKTCSLKNISHWENGVSMPAVGQFLLLCELYGVSDIQAAFRGKEPDYRGLAKLNALGKSRAEEYIAMLSGNALFAEYENRSAAAPRYIRFYDIPVAAGFGSYLDSDGCEEMEADDTVPAEADFAVKVSGDSMIPRFVDGQIVFIKEQLTLEVGEIGIFALDGDAYIKKLGQGKLISLNENYKPIPIREYDSFRVFGKVVG